MTLGSLLVKTFLKNEKKSCLVETLDFEFEEKVIEERSYVIMLLNHLCNGWIFVEKLPWIVWWEYLDHRIIGNCVADVNMDCVTCHMDMIIGY